MFALIKKSHHISYTINESNCGLSIDTKGNKSTLKRSEIILILTQKIDSVIHNDASLLNSFIFLHLPYDLSLS